MTKRIFATLLCLLMIVTLVAPEGFAQERRRRLGTKGRTILTAAAGTGIGAGIGALVGGKRGAAAGALLGGGGATAAYLIKNRRTAHRLGKYGQPIATIGSGTAIGAGIGALVGGGKGAAIGAALGGGGTTAGYLIGTRSRRNNRYARYSRAPRYRRCC